MLVGGFCHKKIAYKLISVRFVKVQPSIDLLHHACLLGIQSQYQRNTHCLIYLVMCPLEALNCYILNVAIISAVGTFSVDYVSHGC